MANTAKSQTASRRQKVARYSPSLFMGFYSPCRCGMSCECGSVRLPLSRSKTPPRSTIGRTTACDMHNKSRAFLPRARWHRDASTTAAKGMLPRRALLEWRVWSKQLVRVTSSSRSHLWGTTRMRYPAHTRLTRPHKNAPFKATIFEERLRQSGRTFRGPRRFGRLPHDPSLQAHGNERRWGALRGVTMGRQPFELRRRP